jgi:tetratricopeptide (TPR) repeat protein
MLQALRRDPRRRRAQLLGAAALVGAAGVGFAVHDSATDRKLEQCRSASLQELWNPERAEALQNAFVASGLPYAGDAWGEIAPRLDAYAGAWVDTRVDACEATHVRGDQSADLFDLRILCLDRSRRELEAVVSVLERADDKTIQNAVEAVSGLPSLGACSEPDQLRGEFVVPEDPAQREALDQLQDSFAQIRALRASGHYGESLEAAKPVLHQLRALGNTKLFATHVTTIANIYTQMGLGHEAESLLEEGLWAAEEGGLDRARAAILVEFVFLVGNLQGDFRRARWFGRAAHAALDRIGESSQLRGDLLTNEAVVEALAGNAPRAIELSERLLESDDEYGLATPDSRASIIGNMGSAYFNSGEYEKALLHYRQAYQLRLQVFGPRHPVISISLENIGNALAGLGRYEESYEKHLEAYEIVKRAKIPEGVRFAVLLNNIAVSLHGQGRDEEAADYWEQSQKIWAKYDPEHAVHGVVLCNLGEIHRARQEYLRGYERYVAGLPILEKAVGPNHPYVAFALGGMGRALNDLGRSSEAIEPLERAKALHEATPQDPLNAAEVDFQLGKALSAQAGYPTRRALELVRGARRSLEQQGLKGKPILEELNRWLDEHAPVDRSETP